MTTTASATDREQPAPSTALITQIRVQVLAADEVSTDAISRVHLGLGGREFRLAKGGDEFARGTQTTFTLGEGTDVDHSWMNDPRTPRLTLADLAHRPLYLRLEVGSEPHWLLERALLTVNPGTDTAIQFDTPRLAELQPGHKLWLGADQGLAIHLDQVRGSSAH
ncbi:hypothetical protein QFZ75_000514 [Streptomyces sp. V3I8]|uniref:hypothetical protein n=1 Tax=Streptomyces sp. V3I8 TaxID=3042279 RepID=UPI00278377FF|nr:hypothetical protein [Streptomyces sp. V3I8]MDQ1034098.1 hypothetical protein [Streptomyces sp. V3I8]